MTTHTAHAAIESLYVAATHVEDRGTLRLACDAATACLDAAATEVDQVETLLFAGTYRTRMLSEPAVAALLAGQLVAGSTGHRLLAFDVVDGPASTLRAWFVAAQLLRAGQTRVLVVSAESPGTSGLRLPDGHGVAASAAACLLSRRCCDDPGTTVPLLGDFVDTAAGLDPRSVWASAGHDGLLGAEVAEGSLPDADHRDVGLPFGTAAAYAVARATSPSHWPDGLVTAALPSPAEPIPVRERSGLGWLTARFGDLPAHGDFARSTWTTARPPAEVGGR